MEENNPLQIAEIRYTIKKYEGKSPAEENKLLRGAKKMILLREKQPVEIIVGDSNNNPTIIRPTELPRFSLESWKYPVIMILLLILTYVLVWGL